MNQSTITESDLRTLADRVIERKVGPCRLFMLQTPIASVVNWRGSFKAFPEFEHDEDLLQQTVVSLLDKGTKVRDRFQIAELLENRGAQVDFSADGLFVEISGRALREDVPDVLALTAEQLLEPVFDPAELDKAKARIAASIQRSMENTGAQASAALTRRLYPRAHPNFTPEPEKRIARLTEIEREAVVRYHEAHFHPYELTLVVVGDLDEVAIEDAIRRHFSGWSDDESDPAPFRAEPDPIAPGRTEIHIPEKQNIDVRLGHELRMRRDHPDYIPAFLSNYVLGGNFSARLMQIVRDEMGLTYGIRSGLYGITKDYSGHWHVAVTLSEENVEKGTDATRAEMRRFIEGGIRAEELEDKKTTIVGGFKVGLATTGGLAATILKNAERGFGVDYLDQFPQEVESVDLDTANSVIQRWFDPDRLHVAVAGSITGSEANQPGASG